MALWALIGSRTSSPLTIACQPSKATSERRAPFRAMCAVIVAPPLALAPMIQVTVIVQSIPQAIAKYHVLTIA